MRTPERLPRLIVVRHGESEANRDHRVTGWSLAVPLTEQGQTQAERAGMQVSSLVGEQNVRLWCSDALRARETAQAVSRRLGIAPEPTSLLREQGLGDLEGRPTSELVALPVPAGSHISEIAWGGGESIRDVHLRMQELLARLEQVEAQCVVLVGHGDSLRVLESVLAGQSHRDVDWDQPGLKLAEVRDLGARQRPEMV